MKQISEFTKNVIAMVKKIPRGRVASYSQIAALAGKPGAARGVVWILHSCSDAYDLPWHRVVNAKGQIAFKEDRKNHREQKRRLEKEGIKVAGIEVNMLEAQWKKTAKPKKAKPRTPSLFS